MVLFRGPQGICFSSEAAVMYLPEIFRMYRSEKDGMHLEILIKPDD